MSERIKPIIERCTSSDLHICQSAVDSLTTISDLTNEEKIEAASGLATLFYRDDSGDERLGRLTGRAEKILITFGPAIIGWTIEQLEDADAESANHFARVLGSLGAPAIDPLVHALGRGDITPYARINYLLACGHFTDRAVLKTIPAIFQGCRSEDRMVKAQAVYALGRIANRIPASDIGDNHKNEIFSSCFDALSDTKALVRRHAVRALGKLQLNNYLNREQLDKAHKSFRAILGLDDYEWDRAYIVRHEAELSLRYFRQENRTDMGHQTGISSAQKYRQDYKIMEKRELVPSTFYFKIHAPLIAQKIEAGQFVIIRPNSHSERIPLSICGWNREEGTIEIIIMAIGRTSTEASLKNVGDSFQDVVGPLGQRSHVQKYEGTCVVLGGGYGTGAVIPTARDLKKMGNRVIGVVGARSKDLLIMTERLQEVCDAIYITTNDGSAGIQGVVTDALAKIMSEEKVSMALAVGPVPMMKAVADATRDKGVQCFVSLNAIMVDGTGMCGACRVTVGDKTKFACFHGPDFDGHQVNFEELSKRLRMFVEKEKVALQALHA